MFGFSRKSKAVLPASEVVPTVCDWTVRLNNGKEKTVETDVITSDDIFMKFSLRGQTVLLVRKDIILWMEEVQMEEAP